MAANSKRGDTASGPYLEPSRLIELLGASAFPAALWSGTELRFLWANRSFVELLHGAPPRFDALGMPIRGFLSDAVSAMRFQDVAYTGLPQTDPEYEYTDAKGELSIWQLTFLPMPGRLGGPSDVLLTGIDVTAQVISRRLAQRASDDVRSAMDLIDTTILSSLEPEEVLQRVVVEATEAFGADWGWIADREPGSWRFRNVHGWPDETVGQRFADGELSLPRLAAFSSGVVLEDGSGLVSAEHRALLERHSIGAFVLVPLMSRGSVTAVIGFCWNEETRLHQAHEQLAAKLSTSLALALDNARLYTAERDAARTLQSAFQSPLPSIDGLAFGHLYHSASAGSRLGGDFFDVVPVSADKVGLMIGDLAGHGVESAALTTLVKHTMRVDALYETAPGSIVRRANEVLLREAPPEMFASAFLGMLDIGSGCMSYCLAGHPAPLLVRDGEPPAFLPGPQVVLGVESDVEYVTNETAMAEGDLLLLYTDGLVEARNRDGESYGADRLRWALGGLAREDVSQVPEAIFLDVFSHSEGRLEDDVAVLAVRRTERGASGPRQERLELIA